MDRPNTPEENTTEALYDIANVLSEIRDELKALNPRQRNEIGVFGDCPRVAVAKFDGTVVQDVTLTMGRWRIVAEKVD